jgi:hypothetical protein
MNLRRLRLGPVFVTALLLTIGGLYYASTIVTAQDKTQTSTDESSKTAPVGFATGTKCTKAGTYRAENKYMELLITLEEGDQFPPMPDGQKVMWYPLTPTTKSEVEPVKTTSP